MRGELRIGVDVPVSERLQFAYFIAHRSYLSTTKNRGEEVAGVSFTWRPFKAR